MRPAHCLAALLAAVTACRTMSATPKHGGAPWREVTTAHFVVWTDLPEAAALQRAADLEDFRRFFVASMFGGADVPGQPTLAIILARDDDWNLMIAAERASYSMGLPAAESPTLGPVLAAPGGDERGFHWGMVGKIHEHVVRIAVRELALDAPPWLTNGLAAYFGAARRDGGAWVLDDQGATLRRYRRDAAAATADLRRVAYLDGEHRERFASLLAAQRRGTAGWRAWTAIFEDLHPDRVLGAADAWLEAGHTRPRRLEQPAGPPPVVTRELTESDVHAARAVLGFLLRPGARPEVMRAHVERALAEDPTHALATLLLQEISPGAVDVARARRVAAAHPDDVHAQAMLVRTDDDAAEREAARAKLCKRVPPAVVERRTGAGCGVIAGPPR